MTREFIPAETLKKQFYAVSHFYDVLVGTQSVLCRSVLEIVRGAAGSECHFTMPDAVVIMMNPGKSRPNAGVPEKLDHTQWPAGPKKLVLTHPDVTQYQIMRLMHYCGWDYVRVLNLSDMREPSSDSFAKRYRRLEDEHKYSMHSIFCSSREAELNASLQRVPGGPIISAWGTNARLDPLIRRCTSAITRHGTVVGLKHHKGAARYRHPLPRTQTDRDAWVNEMVELVRAS